MIAGMKETITKKLIQQTEIVHFKNCLLVCIHQLFNSIGVILIPSATLLSTSDVIINHELKTTQGDRTSFASLTGGLVVKKEIK